MTKPMDQKAETGAFLPFLFPGHRANQKQEAYQYEDLYHFQ